MPKFCKQCGAPLEEDERFCPNCGTQVRDSAQASATPEPSPEPVHEDAYAQEKSRGIDWKQFKPRLEIGRPQIHFLNKRVLVISAAFIVVLVIVALCSK